MKAKHPTPAEAGEEIIYSTTWSSLTRIPVKGGWLYIATDYATSGDHDDLVVGGGVSTEFVPDAAAGETA